MAVLPIQFSGPTFPDGYCPASLQTFSNDLTAGLTASSPITLDNIVISETAPADTTKLWYKIDGSLNPFFIAGGMPIFKWSPTATAWVALHPLEEGTHRWEVFANAGEVPLYEGGNNNPVTDTDGPFWEIDTDFDGRSPMSPGVIQNANPAKTLGYEEDYGEGAEMMDPEAVAPHDHPMNADSDMVNTDGTIKVVDSGVGTAGLQRGNTGPDVTPLSVENNEYTTTQQRMPVIHPVRSMSCIRRTARLYYVG